MRFKELSKFLLFFFIFGQSPSNLNRASNSTPSRIIFITSRALICLAVIVACISFAQHARVNGSFENSSNLAISFINLCAEFLTIGCIAIQSTVFQSNLYELWSKLEQLDRFLKVQFTKKICFAPFANSFRRNARITFIFFGIYALVGFSNSSSLWDGFRKAMLEYLILFTLVGNFHTIFYVDILTFFKDNFCEIVSTMHQTGCENSLECVKQKKKRAKEVYQALLTTKHVFRELKDICEIINQHFGWSIISICIQHIIDLIYSAFWIILYLRPNEKGFAGFAARES